MTINFKDASTRFDRLFKWCMNVYVLCLLGWGLRKQILCNKFYVIKQVKFLQISNILIQESYGHQLKTNF